MFATASCSSSSNGESCNVSCAHREHDNCFLDPWHQRLDPRSLRVVPYPLLRWLPTALFLIARNRKFRPQQQHPVPHPLPLSLSASAATLVCFFNFVPAVSTSLCDPPSGCARTCMLSCASPPWETPSGHGVEDFRDSSTARRSISSVRGPGMRW